MSEDMASWEACGGRRTESTLMWDSFLTKTIQEWLPLTTVGFFEYEKVLKESHEKMMELLDRSEP